MSSERFVNLQLANTPLAIATPRPFEQAAGRSRRFASPGRYSLLDKAIWQFRRYVLVRLIGEGAFAGEE
jgi:hypothetical protein